MKAIMRDLLVMLAGSISPVLAEENFDPAAALEMHRQAQINADGTVTIGKLQWMRCSLGQRWAGETCIGEPWEGSWLDAMSLPYLMNDQGGYAGHTDWRLPTIDELHTLVYCSSGEQRPRALDTNGGPLYFREDIQDGRCEGSFERPTINTELFPPPSEMFFSWSASETAPNSGQGWYVAFNDGFSSTPPVPRSHIGVRLVRSRSGQTTPCNGAVGGNG